MSRTSIASGLSQARVRWPMVWVRWLVLGARSTLLTLVMLVVLWSVALASDSLLRGPAPELVSGVGAGIGPVRAGHWWFPLTSMLWCDGLASYLATTILIVALVPPVERRLGSLSALALLLATQLLGAVSGLGLTSLIAMGGGSWGRQMVGSVAVGPAGAVFGLAIAASAAFSTLWRRRLRLVLLIGLAMLALYSGLLSDLLRLSTGVAGLGIGAWAWRGRRTAAGYTKPEVRLLVALIVAASAIGPLIAAFAQSRVGPLSLLRFVFASPPPDAATVAQMCADATLAADCAHMQALLRLNGLGPAFMSAMPVLLLLAAAAGLRLGRRAAWFAAVGLNVALTALGVVLAVATAASPKRERLMIGPGHHVHTWLLFILPLLQPVLIAVFLVLVRGHFNVRAPAGAYRAWVWRVAYTLLGMSALYVGGSMLFADDYQPVPHLGNVLADLPTRFLPPGYLGANDPAFLPIYPVTTWLYEWTGVVFWGVLLAGALCTFARTPPLAAESAIHVRQLLAAGGSSLSYPVTWSGNSYWFTHDRTSAVAYRVIGGVAITTGNPIGDRTSHHCAVQGFINYCQEQGWTPCLYAVSSEVAAHTRALGWHSVQVAEELVLALGDLAFTGKRWQNVRTAQNNARKLGINTEWCRFSEAPVAITDQIQVISQEWMANKGVPEMGFTLGRIAELVDNEVKLLIAVDQDRTVHAVTSWLPVRRHGQLIGYTLDFMRRRPEAFNGIMEFLIASAARDCQAHGMEILSLSGAPLARVDRGQPPTRLQRILDLLATALEPLYGFKSLLAFKASFRPRYEPLYLAYRDPIALPKIGRAITRAYLPRLTAGRAIRLTPQLISNYRSKHRRPRPPSQVPVSSGPAAEPPGR
jgi:phosphatidylglycerol lysyltransferase